MKKRTFLLFTILLTAFIVRAQEVPVGVVVAFKKGNSQELCRYVGEKIDLVILGNSSNVNNAAAELKLNDFFSQNKVKGFTVNHEGKRDGSSFIIGTLTTETGNFRVNCFFRKLQNKFYIHQIRIDRANE